MPNKITESTVKVSMRDDNDFNCSYAVVCKGDIGVVIVLKDSECAVFSCSDLKKDVFDHHYLLLKHYADDAQAYRDFLKLIGKMCKKDASSKYFVAPKDEDNRMICTDEGSEHMILEAELSVYRERFNAFKEFICRNRHRF